MLAVPLLALVLTAGAVAGFVGLAGSRKVDHPWHYWIAPVIALSTLLVVLVFLPLGYYVRVWRLKQRGR